MLGRLGGRRTECALADDVELDPAVLDLAGVLALDPHLLAELFGDVDRAGVVEVQLQRDDIRAIGLRSRLLRIGHDADAGHLGCGTLQVGDRDVHVVVGRVGARRGHQRQR